MLCKVTDQITLVAPYRYYSSHKHDLQCMALLWCKISVYTRDDSFLVCENFPRDFCDRYVVSVDRGFQPAPAFPLHRWVGSFPPPTTCPGSTSSGYDRLLREQRSDPIVDDDDDDEAYRRVKGVEDEIEDDDKEKNGKEKQEMKKEEEDEIEEVGMTNTHSAAKAKAQVPIS